MDLKSMDLIHGFKLAHTWLLEFIRIATFSVRRRIYPYSSNLCQEILGKLYWEQLYTISGSGWGEIQKHFGFLKHFKWQFGEDGWQF